MSENRTALITGASAGIGAAFARVFAANGYDLVLVARREERLRALADEIASSSSTVTVLPIDLAVPDAMEKLTAELEDREIHIDALVNNAGYGIKELFCDVSWQRHKEMHQVMLNGYTELCYRLLPAMKAREFGRIINVSSVAGLLPASKGSLYAAIKSYVVNLTVALDLEVRDHGIHCTVLCPGATRTEFMDVMEVTEMADRLPNFIWQTAQEVAEEGYQAVTKGKVIKINGWLNRASTALISSLPLAVHVWMGRHLDMIPRD